MRPRIHHRHALAEMAHHRQVVGDEEIGEMETLAQVLEQVHHLSLDRHVERRHCFVADDELGIHGERTGDADALALAARHLVRIPVDELRIEAAHRQEVPHLPSRRRRRIALQPVHADRLGDDVAHLHARIERAVRVLEDHLGMRRPQGHHDFFERHPGDVLAVIDGSGRGSASRAAGCSVRSWSCRSRSRPLRPSASRRGRSRSRRHRPPSRRRPCGWISDALGDPGSASRGQRTSRSGAAPGWSSHAGGLRLAFCGAACWRRPQRSAKRARRPTSGRARRTASSWGCGLAAGFDREAAARPGKPRPPSRPRQVGRLAVDRIRAARAPRLVEAAAPSFSSATV